MKLEPLKNKHWIELEEFNDGTKKIQDCRNKLLDKDFNKPFLYQRLFFNILELKSAIGWLKRSCKYSFENWEYVLFCKKIDKAFQDLENVTIKELKQKR